MQDKHCDLSALKKADNGPVFPLPSLWPQGADKDKCDSARTWEPFQMRRTGPAIGDVAYREAGSTDIAACTGCSSVGEKGHASLQQTERTKHDYSQRELHSLAEI